MKLIECYITGFGRIRDMSYTFGDGITEFLENNGWGKTTFSVFIKAMFFGMEYSRKTKLLERRHYLPWDGGVYGGSLTFSVNDKRYRVERTFGEKDKDDTFALYDAVTGSPSSDYTSNLGEELFEVDRESFERSIFIPQDNIGLGITDSLNAKMGGVANVQDDLKNFEDVIKRIETVSKEYTQTSKVNPGKIKKINEEISAAREQAERIPVLLEAYETKNSMLSEKKAELEKLTIQKEGISMRITKAGEREQSLGEYRAKKQNLEKQQATLDELKEYFKKGVPTQEDMDEWDDRERILEVNRSKREAFRANQPDEDDIEFLEELFDGNPVSDSQIEQWEEQAKQILNLRVRGEHSQMTEEERSTLASLRNFFVKKRPTPDELKAQIALSSRERELSGKLQTLEERYRGLREKENEFNSGEATSGGGFNMMLVVLLVLALFAGGIYFGTFQERSWITIGVAAACFLAAILIFVFGLLLAIVKRNRNARERDLFERSLSEAGVELSESREEYDEVHAANTAFLEEFPKVEAEDIQQSIIEIQRKMDRLNSLEEKEKDYLNENSENLDALSSLQLELYTALSHYTTVLEVNLYDTQQEEQVIKDIGERSEVYREFLSREKEINRISGEINAEYDGIMAVINSYPIEDDSSISAGLKEIRQKVILYNETSKNIEELRNEIEELEKSHRISEEGESLTDLQELQKGIDDKLTALRGVISDEEKSLEECSRELQECEEAADGVEALVESRTLMEDKVRLYDATIDYLTEAKEAFLSAYMGPLQRGMRGYLKKIYSDDDAQIISGGMSLDMDLEIRYKYKGITRSGEYLSSGYQDIIAFCGRMALVDVLYPRQKPMVILDDPFTNYDEAKLEKVKELLAEMALSHQIIYFTCHPSRSIVS